MTISPKVAPAPASEDQDIRGATMAADAARMASSETCGKRYAECKVTKPKRFGAGFVRATREWN